MKTDQELQQDVLDELREEPSVDASQIGVAARDGVVTLTGYVPSFSEKLAAEKSTKRVLGVRAVADDVEVRLPSACQRTDTEIAKASLDALKWSSLVPDGAIKVTVDKGWVTLEGTVDWQYQKNAAEGAVFTLTGVSGVLNSIRVRAKISTADVKEKIFSAFRRSAELEARRIGVDAHGGKVTLHGTVHDWSEVEAAVHAAWSAPGVTEVENQLMVAP